MKHRIKNILKRIGRHLHHPDPIDDQNLKHALQNLATRQTAEYIQSNMPEVQSVESREAVHDVAISKTFIEDGLVMEFGVFSGESINYIASKREWTVDGFDSFEGLPSAWRDGFDRGHFRVSSMPQVRSNVRLFRGLFHNSVPEYLRNIPPSQKIAYLHIDCDLYSSTKTIFDLAWDRIDKGTVIVFDEYFNYDGWKRGEFLAFKEFVRDRKISYRYLTYNYRHEQVAVIID